MLATFAASSAEMVIPLEPVTLLDLTTDSLPTTLAMTNALPNPLTRTPNQLAPMLPLPTLPYVALEMANKPVPVGIARTRPRFDGESPH